MCDELTAGSSESTRTWRFGDSDCTVRQFSHDSPLADRLLENSTTLGSLLIPCHGVATWPRCIAFDVLIRELLHFMFGLLRNLAKAGSASSGHFWYGHTLYRRQQYETRTADKLSSVSIF
jgi:hypothetical protein